jgi:hypothetical protein
MCKAAHYIELVDAQIDYMSATLVYGLSQKTNEIYVFKSSNLISNPEPNSCNYLKKVTMPDEFKEANQLKMTAVKGGLMISSDLG